MSSSFLPPNAEVLIVRLKSLGDILLTSPLADEMLRQRPDLKIDYLVDAAYAGITANFSGIRKELLRPRSWTERIAFAFACRKKYDLVIDRHGSPAAAVFARLASRGETLGDRGKRASFLYHRSPPPPAGEAHTVATHLAFLPLLGLAIPAKPRLALRIDPAATARWREEVGPLAALLHPGARFAHKLWPAEHFRALADHLRERGFALRVLLGPGEPAPPPLAHLPPLTEVKPAELGACLSAFTLFVGNDSGPMHFAAAAGCRVVGLFGPTDRARWSPFTPRGRVVAADCACGAGHQGPCRHPDRWCLGKIGVDEVKRAVEEVLAL